MEADAVAAALKVDIEKGLSSQEAARRLAQNGLNELRAAPRPPAWRRVLAQLRRHVDWPVHPGTFNLRLQGPRWTALRRAMDERPGLPIDPPAGFCAAKCFRARVGAPGLAAAVLLPQVDAYPSDQLELIAPVRLRDALGVADGARLPLWVQL